MTDFLDLPDLACDALGGAAIACNDEFFAEKENLVRDQPAVWKDHVYTDRGKWMDGWETRRRRPPDAIGHASPGGDHDWCIVRLGMPGAIRGVVVDTAFFRGNFPPACAVSAAEIDDALDLRALDAAAWVEILPRSPPPRPPPGPARRATTPPRAPLAGAPPTAFAPPAPPAPGDRRFTHVRLDIFPDGGVARLRVHGEVVPRWSRLTALGGPIDLAAL